MQDKIRLAVIGDSPKLHTGFGTVLRQLCQGFHDAGMEVNVFGLLDPEEDYDKKLPYAFYPTTPMDQLGHGTFGFFLRKIKPDVVFMLSDPGGIHKYSHGIVNDKCCDIRRYGGEYIPPIVAYTPIEGKPMYDDHRKGFENVQAVGKLVVYCNSAREMLQEQFPHIEPEVVYHGLDHADFRQYPEEDRKNLRLMAGLDDFFLIGSIGVNKRTKGFTTIIYAAREMRDRGWDKGVKFYFHTNPENDTMFGYRLKQLAKRYGVYDMIVWKQDIYDNYWIGTQYDMQTVTQVEQIKDRIPDTPEGRGLMFMTYDFVSRLNCLDLYVDTSEIEGWGLCVGEAMMCGVPAISVHDRHVRDEVYSGGAYMIQPEPERMWTTWHPGCRLVLIDPLKVAKAINNFKNDADLRKEYSVYGKEVTQRYKWADAQEAMTKIVTDVYNAEMENVRGKE